MLKKNTIIIIVIIIVIILCIILYNYYKNDNKQNFKNINEPFANPISVNKIVLTTANKPTIIVNGFNINKIINFSQLAVYAMVNGVRTNVATKGTATSTSLHQPSIKASNAIDGILQVRDYSINSFHSANNSTVTEETWTLTLDTTYNIDSIVFYNRRDCCQDRANGLVVQLYNTNSSATVPVDTYTLGNGLIQTIQISNAPAIPTPININKITFNSGPVPNVIIEGVNYGKILTISQVAVYTMVNGVKTNVATKGTATSSSARFPAKNAIDGVLNAKIHDARGGVAELASPFQSASMSNTTDAGETWTLALDATYNIDSIVYWNRDDCCQDRSNNVMVDFFNNNTIVATYYLNSDKMQTLQLVNTISKQPVITQAQASEGKSLYKFNASTQNSLSTALFYNSTDLTSSTRLTNISNQLDSTNNINYIDLNGKYAITDEILTADNKRITIDCVFYYKGGTGVILNNLGQPRMSELANNTEYHAAMIQVITNGNINNLVVGMWGGSMATPVNLGPLTSNTWYQVIIYTSSSGLFGLLNNITQSNIICGTINITPGNPQDRTNPSNGLKLKYYLGIGCQDKSSNFSKTNPENDGKGFGGYISYVNLYAGNIYINSITKSPPSTKIINSITYNIINPPEANRKYSSIYGSVIDLVKTSEGLFIYNYSMLDTRQGWSCSQEGLINAKEEYLQMDLEKSISIAGIVIQGRGIGDKQIITSYNVSYSNDSTNWLPLNNNTGTKITVPLEINKYEGDSQFKYYYVFPNQISARYIRIIPLTYSNHISVRAGVLTTNQPTTTQAPTTTKAPVTTQTPTQAPTTTQATSTTQEPTTTPMNILSPNTTLPSPIITTPATTKINLALLNQTLTSSDEILQTERYNIINNQENLYDISNRLNNLNFKLKTLNSTNTPNYATTGELTFY
jgi:hypothetical protein